MSIDSLKRRLSGTEPQQVEAMTFHQSRMIDATTAELAEAIAANPGHPVAKAWANGIASCPGGKIQTVDRVDLEALIDNREVVTEEAVIKGIRTVVKKLGPKTDKPKATTEKDK